MTQKLYGLVLVVYAASTLLFVIVFPISDFSVSASDLAVLSLQTVYPEAMAELAESADSGGKVKEKETDTGSTEAVLVKDSEEKPEPVVFGDDPAVLILHTHATETYLPASAGNYHAKGKENSVRDVGEVLAKSLEEEGIAVVHDETLHDNPSYSSSYSRSYETISKLLDQYPTIQCVIDLHRDATESDAAGAVLSIGSKTCSPYMYVVSTSVPTYQSNLKFVKKLNSVASSEYGGFTGSVLERGYAYNQGLSDKYLLLEFGNNRNRIEDVRNTARVYGKILAETLKAGY